MRFVLFSMRNFERDGGGSIRMYGILNALASIGDNEVVFISNAKNYTKFHPAIKHINIGYEFNGKSIFQGLLGLFSGKLVYHLYPALFKSIEKALEKANVCESKLIFCEYLDNSIAYVLKKQKKIKNYINDLHGIATIEFKYQRDNSNKLRDKILYNIKYKLSNALDRKVFNYGDGFIYASEAMKTYYENAYPKVLAKKAYILPYVLGEDATKRIVDEKLKQSLLKKYNIEDKDFVIFFAGGYKPTAGIEDLIQAFMNLNNHYQNLKLMLIGWGPTKKKCEEIVKNAKFENKVIFIEKVPYEQLFTHQDLAQIVVCPDRQNPYSELIVHLKYFDSLLSGKIVINGSFKSVKEINREDALSVSFEPSNTEDLYQKLKYCFNNYQQLEEKYKYTQDYVCENLTYNSFIHVLAE